MYNIIWKKPFKNGFRGIALFPFIIVKEAKLLDNKKFMNHEKIHLQQQKELLIILFYAFYIIEFLVRYIQFGDWEVAYYNISFEREAYSNEHDMEYIKNKRIWSFIDYV
jgi:hypothetical protein